jgi:hypothetical protein
MIGSQTAPSILDEAAAAIGGWTALLRCVRLPLPASSRQRNSQTAGPLCRSDRIKLPFCMKRLLVHSCGSLQAHSRHKIVS